MLPPGGAAPVPVVAVSLVRGGSQGDRTDYAAVQGGMIILLRVRQVSIENKMTRKVGRVDLRMMTAMSTMMMMMAV